MVAQTVVFTDLVDSTALTERLGDEEATRFWTEHDRRARCLLAAWAGREIDRSDGFLLLFGDVCAAVCFAQRYQTACAELGLQARVGVHVGEVTLRPNPPADVSRGAKPIQVDGLAVPFAARIMSLAMGGQTLVSPGARNAIGNLVPQGCAISSHGHYRLKGMAEPVEVFEIGVPGQSPFMPPPDAQKGYRVVRVEDHWRPLREVQNNLPPERDAFVGRRRELQALALRLDEGTRFVTLLGLGGTGKTRLVRRYASAWLGDWPGGVFFCDLSEARSLAGICFAVAFSIGVPLAKGDPVVQLGHAIAARGRCLVILDNFEQVVQHASETLGVWLDRAGEATFVATSRERLQLRGESLMPIEPLELETDAVALFDARARAVKRDFVVDGTNRPGVIAIAKLLDGLPLAIELAAARVRVLPLAEIVRRLKDRFAFLAGARGVAARQATLKATIDWSWDLLAPHEQAVLAQCSVFEGGFTLDAAEGVLDLTRWPAAPAPVDVVEGLVDKSLLRVGTASVNQRVDFDEPYFSMYLSIHEYAAQRLAQEGGEALQRARRRHGLHYALHGSDTAIASLSTHGSVERRLRLSLDVDNLAVACRRAIERTDAEVAAPCYRAVWAMLEAQGPYVLGMQLGAALEAMEIEDSGLRASVALTYARAADASGAADIALRCAGECLEIARERKDPRAEADALAQLGNVLRVNGSIEAAGEHLSAALALSLRAGDQRAAGWIHGRLGDLARDQGKTADALQHYNEMLSIATETGDRRTEGAAVGNVGCAHHELGELDVARTAYLRALTINREVGDRRSEEIRLSNLGVLYHDMGDYEASARAHEQALNLSRDIGSRRGEAASHTNLGAVFFDQGKNDAALICFEQALAISRELNDKRNVGMLLSNLGAIHRNRGEPEKARAAFVAALDIHRAVACRSDEAMTLTNLGVLMGDGGQWHDAIEHLQRAVAIYGELGHRPMEGASVGELGVALAALDQAEPAREAFERGERLLRGTGHSVLLAIVLCQRGCYLAAHGAIGEARSELAEAIALAEQAHVPGESQLGSWIKRLQQALSAG